MGGLQKTLPAIGYFFKSIPALRLWIEIQYRTHRNVECWARADEAYITHRRSEIGYGRCTKSIPATSYLIKSIPAPPSKSTWG